MIAMSAVFSSGLLARAVVAATNSAAIRMMLKTPVPTQRGAPRAN